MYLIILILISCLTYLIIKYPNRSIGTKSRNDIKGIKGYPLIGNLIDTYNTYIIHLMNYLLVEYGPIA